MNRALIVACLLMPLLIQNGCNSFFPKPPEPEEILEGPVEELTKEQSAVFLAGDEAFGHVFSPREGLGPVFIANSCAGCHAGDGKGHPMTMVTRFGKYENSVFDYMYASGGPQLQNRAVPSYLPETLPAEAQHISRRLAPAVVGLGYLAAVHDSVLKMLADPFDMNPDGISGRLNYVMPESFFQPRNIHLDSAGYYIGRFGKKAKQVSLLGQIVFALKEDIGITSPFDPADIYNIQTGLNTGDNAPDPEVSADFVFNIVFYLRTLKVPSRRDQNKPEVIQGEKLFSQLGCVKCHLPELKTAKSDIEPLSEKIFHPYTDLLLHDMGPGLDDGFPEGNAAGSEWRTAPLWGLGLASTTQGGKGYYLHDGRVSALQEVILYHGGEASSARDAFYSLSAEEKNSLLVFLGSL